MPQLPPRSLHRYISGSIVEDATVKNVTGIGKRKSRLEQVLVDQPCNSHRGVLRTLDPT